MNGNIIVLLMCFLFFFLLFFTYLKFNTGKVHAKPVFFLNFTHFHGQVKLFRKSEYIVHVNGWKKLNA